MATYDYHCPECGWELIDVVYSIHEDPEPEFFCIGCEARLIKTVGNVNFKVKGFSLRNRRRQLEARFRRREKRTEWKNMTEDQKARMARIANKYGNGTPWTYDPTTENKKSRGRMKDEADKKLEETRNQEEKKLRKRKGIQDFKLT